MCPGQQQQKQLKYEGLCSFGSTLSEGLDWEKVEQSRVQVDRWEEIATTKTTTMLMMMMMMMMMIGVLISKPKLMQISW
jgi:hypothetical protein